ISIFEPGRFVKNGGGKAMTAIERRRATIVLKTLEILHAARGEHGGEKVGGAVVDGMAKGIGQLQLQAVCEAAVQLALKPVIDRGTVRPEGSNEGKVSPAVGRKAFGRAELGAGSSKPRRDISWNVARSLSGDRVIGTQRGERDRESIEFGLSWSGQERRQRLSRGGKRRLDVDPFLHVQVNSARAHITHLGRVGLSEGML